jgi:hypothetical protein
MIIAPTPCYFVIKTEGEAASHIVSEVSPLAGNDIITAVLVSADFDSDIQAVHHMDAATAHITSQTPGEGLETQIEYNPIYLPGEMSAVDEMLNLDPRNDGIRFVGMSGNPYLLKTVVVKSGDEQLVVAKVEYRPFDIPGYNELVEARTKMLLN